MGMVIVHLIENYTELGVGLYVTVSVCGGGGLGVCSNLFFLNNLK